METNRARPWKDYTFDHSIPFRGPVWILVSSEQREMGNESWRRGRRQNETSTPLAKKRQNRHRTGGYLRFLPRARTRCRKVFCSSGLQRKFVFVASCW